MTVNHPAQKLHRLRKLRGESAYHDVTPARLHLATLLGAGWSLRSIAGVSGVAATTLSRVSTGKQDKAAASTITRVLAVRPDVIADRTDRPGGDPFVSRVGAVRRIQALLWLGWTHADMRERSGVRTAVIMHQQGRWITRSTHDKIAALYAELCMTPGPSNRTRSRAKARGYHGPFDWNNIDTDPAADTDLVTVADSDYDEVVVIRFMAGDRSLPTTNAERIEILRRWPATGRPLAELERAGWNLTRLNRKD